MKASKGAVIFLSVLILGSVILGSGCTSNNGNNSENGNKSETVESRVVKVGDTVQVDYTGKLENGTVFDTSREDVAKQAGIYDSNRTYAPLAFVAGSGQMIKGFDSAVIGMKVEEEKTIIIHPEDAYGEYDSAKVQTVPIKALNMTIVPKVGQVFGDSYGNQYRVVSVNETYVTLDANPELAGKTLVFDIRIVSIK